MFHGDENKKNGRNNEVTARWGSTFYVCYVVLTKLHASSICFFFIEDLVLEESPKWKLLADVLDEIERDDAKNDTKRNLHCFGARTFIKALFQLL